MLPECQVCLIRTSASQLAHWSLITQVATNCLLQVLMVENKRESIMRVIPRIRDANVSNVTLYQVGNRLLSISKWCKLSKINFKNWSQQNGNSCFRQCSGIILSFQSNLNYFIGKFSIGTCLHACGIATDLVLNKCLEANASFVATPCCYGAIKQTDEIRYPRSCLYRNLCISFEVRMRVTCCVGTSRRQCLIPLLILYWIFLVHHVCWMFLRDMEISVVGFREISQSWRWSN